MAMTFASLEESTDKGSFNNHPGLLWSIQVHFAAGFPVALPLFSGPVARRRHWKEQCLSRPVPRAPASGRKGGLIATNGAVLLTSQYARPRSAFKARLAICLG